MRSTVLGGVVVALAPAWAMADVEKSVEVVQAPVASTSLGVFLGVNYFPEDIELGNAFHADQVPHTAFLLGLRGAYMLLPAIAPDSPLDPAFSIELEGKFAFSSTDSAEGRDSRFAPVLGWRAHALLDLMRRRALSPFILAGAGGETVFSDKLFMTSPDTDAALHVGTGAKYDLTSNVGMRLDLRAGFTAGRISTTATTFEAHLGGYWQFGAKEPPPKMAAAEPEPSGPSDSDGDGLADADDKCPNEAENLNGIDDEDGCPETDSDGDGLLGSQDKCPDAAEDFDGFEDDDGCPEDDNDGDQIPDRSDQCPNDPETVNGYEDEDGCPDELPDKLKKFTGAIEGIRFRLGSAKIRPQSFKKLDQAVATFTEYPALLVEISGHTDTTGGHKRNMELSAQRAEAVKAYLVKKGIDAARLTTVGHGPEQPVADNNTKDGRAQNRRIEFKLISRPGATPADSGKTDQPSNKKGDTVDPFGSP